MLNSFYWILENELAGMAMPSASRAYIYMERADDAARNESLHEIQELRELGIGGVVTLTESPLDAALFEEAGMTYLHIPVPDMTAPTPSQIEEFISFVDEQLAEGRAVVAHCLGGSGRTGTMLACYLVHRGQKPKAAIQSVRRVRPSAIENRWQEEAVLEFAHRRKHPDIDMDI